MKNINKLLITKTLSIAIFFILFIFITSSYELNNF